MCIRDRVCSAHVPAPIGDDADRVLDFMNRFGAKRVISGMSLDDFGSVDPVSYTHLTLPTSDLV